MSWLLITWKQGARELTVMVLAYFVYNNPGPARQRLVYCQISITSRTLVGDNIVYHSDVDGASPVGAAPTTSSFST